MALKVDTFAIEAVTFPPNDAEADNETATAVTTVFEGTVCLTLPPPGADTTVVGRVGRVEVDATADVATPVRLSRALEAVVLPIDAEAGEGVSAVALAPVE